MKNLGSYHRAESDLYISVQSEVAEGFEKWIYTGAQNTLFMGSSAQEGLFMYVLAQSGRGGMSN